MIEVVVGNSVCEVRGATNADLKQLREVCAYTVTTGKKIPLRNKFGKVIKMIPVRKKRFLMSPKGVFPTGLLLRVLDNLSKAGRAYKVSDPRKVPKLHSISEKTLFVKKEFEPYIEQFEAADAAMKAGRGIIVGPTGVGKSAICGLVIDAFRVNTLIVVPSLELKRQLTETLRESFGYGMVGPLGKFDEPSYPITVENVDALNPNLRLKNIDLVIVDEFHHSAATTYRQLNLVAWQDIYYKIGLTATPFRSQDEEQLLLESVLSEVIYEIPYELAVAKGYIVPMEVYYIDMPIKVDKVLKNGRKRVEGSDTVNWHKSYTDDVVTNELRNHYISTMVSNLIDEGVSTLVLTKQVAHGDILRDLMSSLGHDVAFAEGTSELKTEDIAAFNACRATALIGTTGVIGEGVDTKPAEWIILAGGGKSKNQFMQNVGRGFRRFGSKTSCKILMIRDANNKWLLEHFNKCRKYLKQEYGVTAVKLDLAM